MRYSHVTRESMRNEINQWTVRDVQVRIGHAVDTIKAMPGDKAYVWLRAARISQPVPVRGLWDTPSVDGAMRPALPTPADIADMDEALAWLEWLDVRVRSILLARAGGAPWEDILSRIGIGRTRAHVLEKRGLQDIADRLNESGVRK